MDLEVVFRLITLATQLTKVFLSRVYCRHVSLEARHEGERLVTHCADVRSVPRVKGPVILEARQTHKGFAAYTTRVNLGFSMYPLSPRSRKRGECL